MNAMHDLIEKGLAVFEAIREAALSVHAMPEADGQTTGSAVASHFRWWYDLAKEDLEDLSRLEGRGHQIPGARAFKEALAEARVRLRIRLAKYSN